MVLMIMIYVVVHLYAGPGGINALRTYEREAIKIAREYGAELISAFVPQNSGENAPDEIHLMTFPSEERLEDYRNDQGRLHLQNEHQDSIADANIYISSDIIEY